MTHLAEQSVRLGRSPGFKFFLISFLILLLLVPLLLVYGLVSEREGRANSVQADVARTWGGAQQIVGPFLVVPYSVVVRYYEGEKMREDTQERRAVFTPSTLSVKGAADHKLLHRSIFDVTVYDAHLAVEGRFDTPDIADVDPNARQVRWADASIVLGISDVSGLKEAATFAINGSDRLAFEPSLGVPGLTTNGIHTRLAKASTARADDGSLKGFSFAAKLVFAGSGQISFAPAARETAIELSSGWPHPSFTGSFLPAERTVTQTGFSAKWHVPHLARSVPSAWNLSEQGVDRFSPYMFGVTFYQPVDFYDAVNRAAKYGLLFLALAFMAVFVLELTSGGRVHAVQYLFVGLAMIFFYVLLLSIAEHAGFLFAYIVASLATGGMLSVYVGMALKRLRSGLLMLALFLTLYGFLYLILQLEDYALLAGAILGFSALTAVMFATLRVDWSGRGEELPAAK